MKSHEQMGWNASTQVTRSIAPRTLRECRKAAAAWYFEVAVIWHDPSEVTIEIMVASGSPKWTSSVFHILIFCYLWSHQLYTLDIKTKLDPRVLIFCLGFSHSTSWCFRQRRQGKTSMASSCTSNAMDCNVTMPRGVARSTGQTTSTLDWAEGNVGQLHNMSVVW